MARIAISLFCLLGIFTLLMPLVSAKGIDVELGERDDDFEFDFEEFEMEEDICWIICLVIFGIIVAIAIIAGVAKKMRR